MYNRDHSRQSHIRNLIQSYYLTRPECFYPIHPLFFFHPNTSTCLTVEYTLHTSEKSLMQFRELNLFLYGSGSPYRKKSAKSCINFEPSMLSKMKLKLQKFDEFLTRVVRQHRYRKKAATIGQNGRLSASCNFFSF